MTEIRSLGRHTLVYGLGIAIGKLASFLMLPIYTRFLTPTDYGVLELLSMTVDVIGTIAGVGLAASVFKFYADQDGDRERNEVVSTAAMGVIGLAVATTVLGLVASPGLSWLVLGEDGTPAYFRLFFLIYLAQSAEAIPLLLIRALQRSTLFVLINVAKLIAMLSLNIFFVVVLRMSVLGVLVSNLIVTAVSALGLSIFLFKHVGASFSGEKFRAMARFGYPVMFVYLGNFVLVFSDRYFLNHFTGTDAVGIYSLAYKFAFILSAIAFTPFQMIWAPQRFVIAKRPDAGEIFTRVFLYMNLAVGIIAMGIALFTRDVLVVMAEPAFRTAHAFVPLLLLAQIVHHWTAFANFGLFVKSRTGEFARWSLVGVGAVIVLNLLLIPRWGIWGAAWATTAAYLVRFVTIAFLSQRQYAIAYGWAAVGRLYVIIVGAVGARAALGNLPVAVSVVLGFAIAAAAVVGVYGLVLDRDDKARVRRALRRPKALLMLGARPG